MTIPDIIIAIDGCSSTGKSSLAKLVARELGFMYLDSGALYRAVTLFAREQKLILPDDTILPELEARLSGLDVHFGQEGTFIGERNVEREIRTLEVSSQVSPISALAYVRVFVDEKLHEFGKKGRIVMDGRDIGTTVFPDAKVKIFLTASEEVRAKRRFDELKAKGDNPSMEEVITNIRERDYIDSHREVSPLKCASDAFVLDNSSMTFAEEVAWIKGLVRGRCAAYEQWD